jgi:palmitoyl-protein thioesterase
MGVSDLPGCARSDPIWCSLARSAARLGVYSEWAQQNLVQAQYFRDVDRIEQYFEANTFLTKLNAEVGVDKNETGRMKENLSNLENFVMVLFTQDTTVVPKESAWFGSYAVEEKELGSINNPTYRPFESPWWPFSYPKKSVADRTIIPMRLQPLYEEDSIGLRTLDESGRVHLETCDAGHMHIKLECWEDIVHKYVGGRIDDVPLVPSPLVVQGY